MTCQRDVDSQTEVERPPTWSPPERETSEFPPMLRRLMRAHARRVGAGDTYDLREMYELRLDLDEAIADAIGTARQRDPHAWSWTEIGEVLGMSRQAAQQRWGKP